MYQEKDYSKDITVLNIYTPNSGHTIYKIYTTGFKNQIDINPLIIDDFNNLLSPVDRLSR